MLVLSRKLGQRFQVGHDIRVTIVKIDRNSVRIGIEAPGDVTVYREEIVPVEAEALLARSPRSPEGGLRSSIVFEGFVGAKKTRYPGNHEAPKPGGPSEADESSRDIVLRVVLAPDKFKWSLSAPDAARAMARGVRTACHEAICVLVPMADGGEGTVEALIASTEGSVRSARVTGPLGEPRDADWGLLGDGSTAVLEMASASGLKFVPAEKRDPAHTTTLGAGELFRSALDQGIRRFILGIGGSATNDGGAGFAQALGYRLLDKEGTDLGPGGGPLERLDRIDASGRDPRLDRVQLRVACDVDNPLCGPRGASAVYGPQKGADEAMIARLDRNLADFARVVGRDLGVDILDLPGSGAAGGLGGGLIAFAGGRLEPGIDLVIEAVGLRDKVAGADLCLTGEGAIDASSGSGKTAVGVARLARSLGVPTLAFAGTIGEGAEAVLHEGIDAFFSICPGPIELDEAIARASELLERTVAHAVRTFLAGRRT